MLTFHILNVYVDKTQPHQFKFTFKSLMDLDVFLNNPLLLFRISLQCHCFPCSTMHIIFTSYNYCNYHASLPVLNYGLFSYRKKMMSPNINLSGRDDSMHRENSKLYHVATCKSRLTPVIILVVLSALIMMQCLGSTVSNRIISKTRYSQYVAVFVTKPSISLLHHKCSTGRHYCFAGRHFESSLLGPRRYTNVFDESKMNRIR